MSVSVKAVGLEEIQALLTKLSKQTSDMQPIMAGISEILKFDTQESFEKRASPFGQAWKESKHWLHDSGALSSFNTSATAYSAEVYTSVVYAAIHQFGGFIGRKKNPKIKKSTSRFTPAKRGYIPARPFLPINNAGQLAPHTEQAIVNFIKKKLLP